MKEIIETTQLEFDKSAFLIDLVKHESGSLYIEIVQTINNNSKDGQTIKINPSVLSDIIKILQNYEAKIPGKIDHRTKHITEEDKQKIQDRYLIGVSLKDLALQFDQSEELIEMVLRNRGIQIISNEIPKVIRWRGWKR